MGRGGSSVELSIVIPTFNYAQFVERAINSVLSQMSEKAELIVVDDGSSDNTPDVLAALMAMGCQRFRCLRQENAGPAAARNHGFSRSVGRFILFLDADDELLPGAIDKIVQAIEADPGADLILGAYLARSPSGSGCSQRQRRISGCTPSAVSSLTLCCVGLVFNSPAAAI